MSAMNFTPFYSAGDRLCGKEHSHALYYINKNIAFEKNKVNHRKNRERFQTFEFEMSYFPELLKFLWNSEHFAFVTGYFRIKLFFLCRFNKFWKR